MEFFSLLCLHVSFLSLKMAREWVCFSRVYLFCACMCSFSSTRVCVYVCVCIACHSICWYEHVLYGRRSLSECVWVGCALGVLRVVWSQAESSSLLRLCVCVCERVCVWCGQRLKRASVHMGTNDRIWFSEPICKKDERNQTSKKLELRPCQTSHRDFTAASDGQLMVTSFHSASLQQLWATAVIWMPPQLQNTWHKRTHYKPILGLQPNNTGEMLNKQKQPNYPHWPLLLPKSWNDKQTHQIVTLLNKYFWRFLLSRWGLDNSMGKLCQIWSSSCSEHRHTNIYLSSALVLSLPVSYAYNKPTMPSCFSGRQDKSDKILQIKKVKWILGSIFRSPTIREEKAGIFAPKIPFSPWPLFIIPPAYCT